MEPCVFTTHLSQVTIISYLGYYSSLLTGFLFPILPSQIVLMKSDVAKPKSDPITSQLKTCSGSPFHSGETQTLSHGLPGPTHLVLGLFSKLTSFQSPIPLPYTLASMEFLEHTRYSSTVGSLH